MDPGSMVALGTGAYGLAAGLYSDSENRRIAKENAADTNAASERSALRNIEMQREFAKHGIRWKVEDAQAAGIHPLYALGASGASFSPVTSVFDPGPSGSAAGDLAKRTAETGQNLSRAMQTGLTADEQAANKLRLISLDLDNQIKASQLRQLNAPTAGPGSQTMIPGQGNSALINNIPQKRTVSKDGYSEPGAHVGLGFQAVPGGLIPVPSSDAKERIEDNIIQEVMWSVRNNLLPNFTGGTPPPGYVWDPTIQGYVKEGEKWRWTPIRRKDIDESWYGKLRQRFAK